MPTTRKARPATVKGSVTKAIVAATRKKKLTDADRVKLRAAVEAAIDTFLRGVGYANPAQQVDEHGWRHLLRGTVEGFACVESVGEDLFLHVEAMITRLPSDQGLIQALMRQALEWNLAMPGTCRIGIRGAAVLMAATENVLVLHDDEDVARMVHTVMDVANTIDQEFHARYDGTTRTRPGA